MLSGEPMKAISRRPSSIAPCQATAMASSERPPKMTAPRRSRRASAARDRAVVVRDARTDNTVTRSTSCARHPALADMGMHHDQHADIPDADLIDDDRPAIGIGLWERLGPDFGDRVDEAALGDIKHDLCHIGLGATGGGKCCGEVLERQPCL